MEKLVLIATRNPPGDRWSLVNDETIYSSLTETLEAYFQKNQIRCEFRLAPLKGELYVITEEEDKPIPPKKFNLYGDY